MKIPAPLEIPKNSPRLAPAFTLVEVLTVIAIISILMTAGAIGLGNLTAGKGTSSAVATAESLFEEARTIATSKRCKARVLVDIDDPTSPNFLRRIVIAHEKIRADGSVDEDNFVLAGRGYTMPTGTFFSRNLSLTEGGTKISEIDPPVTLTTGDGVTAAYAGKYASYEFNAEGIFSEPGASFIIGAGVFPKSATEPRIAAGAERDFAGFVIWRNGRTSSYRSPKQMGIPDDLTTF